MDDENIHTGRRRSERVKGRNQRRAFVVKHEMNKRCQPDKNNQKRTANNKSGDVGKGWVRGRETFISCGSRERKDKARETAKKEIKTWRTIGGAEEKDRLSSSNR